MTFAEGVGEMLLGGGLIAVPEPTALTKVVGAALIGHGADHVVAGVTGRKTLTAQATSEVLQAVGMDSETAEAAADTVDTTIGAVGTAGAAAKVVTAAGKTAVKVVNNIDATRLETAGKASALGKSAKALNGVPATANFAQTGFREAFSKAGAAELSKITDTSIKTIDDLAGLLRTGAVSPSQIPVNIITRGQNTLILNTRTVQALERAGIPRNHWHAIDQSGNEVFEKMLTDQLKRNQLSKAGTLQTFVE